MSAFCSFTESWSIKLIGRDVPQAVIIPSTPNRTRHGAIEPSRATSPRAYYCPLATFAALFAHLAGERQLKIGTQGGAEQRTVERERRFPRRLERFLPD